MMNPHREILVVDGDSTFRILAYKKFKALGYPTFLAQNGEEAVVSLWEKQSIGLVLLDFRLVSNHGLNVFEIIRKDFPDKKVVICSSSPQDGQHVLINHVDDYYCKENGLDSLIEKVDKILNNKSRIGEQRKDEKRNFKRVPVHVYASCERINYQTYPACVHFFSYAKDLSLHGGRFVIAEDLQIGQHFSASLELPTNFLPILIDCEVVWVKKLEDYDLKGKKNNEVGVRFVKLDLSKDEEKLKNYLSYV